MCGKVKRLTVSGFIHLLVQHIPEGNQKMIHYYSLYARRQANQPKKIIEDLVRSFNQRGWEEEQEKLLSEILSFPTSYRERIKLTFNKDPYICPVCGEKVVTERIVGPGEVLSSIFMKQIILRISLIWRTMIFNPFKKRKKNLQGITSFYCPQCKKEQAIPII